MTRPRFARWLAAVGVFALAGRVLYILTVTRHQHFPRFTVTSTPTRSLDEAWYVAVAHSLVNGDLFRPTVLFTSYETALHGPVTALALVPGALLDSELVMRFTVALAGTGVVLVAGLLASRLAGPTAGVCAALVAALYPNLWMNDGLLMSETFATLFAAVSVLLAYETVRRPTWLRAAGLGAAAALAALSRSELALLVPVMVLPVIVVRTRLRLDLAIRLAGVALAGSAVVVTPWIAHNLTRFDEPVLLTTSGGPALAGTNCDAVYSGPLIGFYSGTCVALPATVPGDESVRDRAYREDGLEHAGDHLGELPRVAAARIGRMWGVFRPVQAARFARGEGRPLAASLAGWAMSWPLIGLGVVGAWSLRRRGVTLLPLLAPIVVVTLDGAAFYGNGRFRSPAEVSIVVLAAIGLVAVADRVRARGRRFKRTGA